MKEFEVKIEVDTTDIDRLAIGQRLYDMFKEDNAMNKLHQDNKGKYMLEKDINTMYRLVNNTEDKIMVWR